MSDCNIFQIFGLNIVNIDYNKIIHRISGAVSSKKRLTMTYANINTLNLVYENNKLLSKLLLFDIIHTDGIGAYYVSKFLEKNNSNLIRFTGSDFYPLLIEECIRSDWKIFFFGDTNNTLNRIKKKNMKLNIVGIFNGYNFKIDEVVEKICFSNADIIIVGLGQPKQESWIVEHLSDLESKVIIAVGDGIKVFAGTKVRGPKIFQILGFEWLVRLLDNPFLLWNRYLIGIPQFIFRFIKKEVLKNG